MVGSFFIYVNMVIPLNEEKFIHSSVTGIISRFDCMTYILKYQEIKLDIARN